MTSTKSAIIDAKTPMSFASSTPLWNHNDVEEDDEKSLVVKLELSEEHKVENIGI